MAHVVAATLVLNLLDGVLTLISTSLGLAVEANPLMNNLLACGPIHFILGKVGLVSVSMMILWRLRERTSAVAAMVAALALYASVNLYHLHGLLLAG